MEKSDLPLFVSGGTFNAKKLLEYKTANYYNQADWGESDTDTISLPYLYQRLWYLGILILPEFILQYFWKSNHQPGKLQDNALIKRFNHIYRNEIQMPIFINHLGGFEKLLRNESKAMRKITLIQHSGNSRQYTIGKKYK